MKMNRNKERALTIKAARYCGVLKERWVSSFVCKSHDLILSRKYRYYCIS